MIRRILLWAGAVIIIGLLVIQLVPYGRDHGNPPVTGEPNWNSAETRRLVVTACYDCHSNETSWPWYTNVAPVSWLAQHDVDEGRQSLNFSEWDKPQDPEDAAELVSSGKMPPLSYTLIHPNASLSDADRQALIDGLRATFGGEGGGGGNSGEGDE
jgi:hypothetical protein